MGLTEASAFKDGKIINDDINASAAIARTKLANVDLLDDTTPQLGGTLQTNGNMIKFPDATGVNVNRLKFGTHDDLHVYHNGSNSTIRHEGTGNLLLTTVSGSIKLLNGNDNMLIATPNGGVFLYESGTKRFETTDTGVAVTGNTIGTGRLEYTHTGTSDTTHFLFKGTQASSSNNNGTFFKIEHGRGSGNTNPILDVRNSANSVFSVTGTGQANIVGAGLNVTGNLSVTGTTTLPNQGQGLVPVGTVITFAGSTPPTGYLKANGDTIPNGTGTVQSTTADFSALHAIVGATLPDLRGEFVRGWADNRNVDAGRTIRSTQGDQFKNHQHQFGGDDQVRSQGGYTRLGDFSYDASSTTSGGGKHMRTKNDNTNSGGTETRPRNVALLMCIKY